MFTTGGGDGEGDGEGDGFGDLLRFGRGDLLGDGLGDSVGETLGLGSGAEPPESTITTAIATMMPATTTAPATIQGPLLEPAATPQH